MEAYCLVLASGRPTFQAVTVLQCSNRASIFTDVSERFAELHQSGHFNRGEKSVLYSHHQGRAGRHWPPPCSCSCCYSGTVKEKKKSTMSPQVSVISGAAKSPLNL